MKRETSLRVWWERDSGKLHLRCLKPAHIHSFSFWWKPGRHLHLWFNLSQLWNREAYGKDRSERHLCLSLPSWWDPQKGSKNNRRRPIHNRVWIQQNNVLTSITYPTGRTITYTPDEVEKTVIRQVDTTLNGIPKNLATGSGKGPSRRRPRNKVSSLRRDNGPDLWKRTNINPGIW